MTGAQEDGARDDVFDIGEEAAQNLREGLTALNGGIEGALKSAAYTVPQLLHALKLFILSHSSIKLELNGLALSVGKYDSVLAQFVFDLELLLSAIDNGLFFSR